jgi:hypothetical protein
MRILEQFLDLPKNRGCHHVLVDMIIAFSNQRAADVGRVSARSFASEFESARDDGRSLHFGNLSTAAQRIDRVARRPSEARG